MLVVLAHGETPESLLAAVSGSIPARSEVVVERTAWGSALIGDAPHAKGEQWLVAGRPQRDPWGLPLGDLPLAQAVAEYDRYGFRAAHLGSGPFLAADLVRGRLMRMPNGIVPAYAGTSQGGLVLATSERVLRLLASDLREIRPGRIEGPDGHESVTAPPRRESDSDLEWAWLEEEIEARVARLGPLAPTAWSGSRIGPADGSRWLRTTVMGEAVLLPPVGRASGRDAARPEVASRLFSRARRNDQWLFAPVLEGPARDAVALLGGGTGE